MKTPKLLKTIKKGKVSNSTIKYYRKKKSKKNKTPKHQRGGVTSAEPPNSIALQTLEKYNIADNLHDYGGIFSKESIMSLTLKTMPAISTQYNNIQLDENNVLNDRINSLTSSSNAVRDTTPYISYRIEGMMYTRAENDTTCHFSEVLQRAGILQSSPIFLIVDTHYPNFTNDIQQLGAEGIDSNRRNVYWCKTIETAFDPAGKTTPKTKPNLFFGFGSNQNNGVIYAEQDCSPGNTMGTMFPPWPTVNNSNSYINRFDYNNINYLDTTLFCSKMMINLLSIKYKKTYESIAIIHDKNAKKYIYSDKKLARKQITIFNKGQYKKQWSTYETICKQILNKTLPPNIQLGLYKNEYQLLSKRMGDQGQALACLSKNTNFIPITNPIGLKNGCNQPGTSAISSTNGYFCFVSYDRVAICHALNYNVPLILHLKPTTNQDIIPILYVRKDITSQRVQQDNLITQLGGLIKTYNELYSNVITNYDNATYNLITSNITDILNGLQTRINESTEPNSLNISYQAIFIIYILLQSPCEILHNYNSIVPTDPSAFSTNNSDSTSLDSYTQQIKLITSQIKLVQNKEKIQGMFDDININLNNIKSIAITEVTDIYDLGKYIDKNIYSNIKSYNPFTLGDRRVSNRGILGALEKDFGLILITKYINNNFIENIYETDTAYSFKDTYNKILNILDGMFSTEHAYIATAITNIRDQYNLLQTNSSIGGAGTRSGNPLTQLNRNSDWLNRVLTGIDLNIASSDHATSHINILIDELIQHLTTFHQQINEPNTSHSNLIDIIKTWTIIEVYAKSLYSVFLDILFITHKNATHIANSIRDNSMEYPDYINVIYSTFIINDSPSKLIDLHNIFSNNEAEQNESGDDTSDDIARDDAGDEDAGEDAGEDDEGVSENTITETDYNLLHTQIDNLNEQIPQSSMAYIFLNYLNNDTNTYDGNPPGQRGGSQKREHSKSDEPFTRNKYKKNKTHDNDETYTDASSPYQLKGLINGALILFRFYQYTYKYFNRIIEIDLKTKTPREEKYQLIKTELDKLMDIHDVKMADTMDYRIPDVKMTDTMQNKMAEPAVTSAPMVFGGKKYNKNRIIRSKHKTKRKRRVYNGHPKKRTKKTRKTRKTRRYNKHFN